ncbi:hypothetical protein [Salimicrobium flavidum]|uniref:Uncharacterized protein n=1 Tax=Salimicrobium flavidum TaxID=570947 RepID=A0A1N7J721_9BACI|nr:hypothetical protein [Salimicrobium flavidum]SIS45120.1 hypothetical protein SAMN05421687_10450 [Salimicrobium flavidum]
MTKVVDFITVLIILGVVVSLTIEATMESVTIQSGVYIISSFIMLFTVGFRYYFTMDEKSLGLALMALSIAGILLTVTLTII